MPTAPTATETQIGTADIASGSPAAVTSSVMVIDRQLPEFHATRSEHRVIDASVPRTWQAICDLDLLEVHTPLLDAVLFVRGLPQRIGQLYGPGRPARHHPDEWKLADVGGTLPGWTTLGRVPQREVAFGAVGRFWHPGVGWRTIAADDFVGFDDPGYGKVAINLSLRPYGATRTLLSHEVRTTMTDPDSRRRFARYWLLVEPFAGHAMRAILSSIARDAERYL